LFRSTGLTETGRVFRYLTLDYWKSEEEFRRFREQNLAEYERLDKEFEGLTESETHLGAFWSGKAGN
jgi:hypothetical protein